MLVVAAPGDEFIGALPDLLDLLDRYHPRRAVNTRAPGRSATYRALQRKLIDRAVETVDASTLPRLDLGSSVSLSVLADADTGSVLRLEWGKFSLVMAPALDTAGETVAVVGAVRTRTALSIP